jgi:ComF family protein
MSLSATLESTGRTLVDFLFPQECPLCFEHSGEAGRIDGTLCKGCRERLIPRPLALCLACGAPLGPYQRPMSQCAHCYRDRFAFSRVWSLGKFDGELRQAIHKAKSRHGQFVTAALAQVVCELFRDELMNEAPDIVIGVPHHWSERLANTHHASEAAAIKIAECLGCRFAGDAIIKVKRTRKQATLVPTDRRKNLADAFRLRRGHCLKGQRILLVDDVLTTGTTAHRIASMLLRQAGAKDVRICVLARGVGQA